MLCMRSLVADLAFLVHTACCLSSLIQLSNSHCTCLSLSGVQYRDTGHRSPRACRARLRVSHWGFEMRCGEFLLVYVLLFGFADHLLYSSQSLRPDLASSSFASLLAYLACCSLLRLWRAFSADFLSCSSLRPRTLSHVHFSGIL